MAEAFGIVSGALSVVSAIKDFQEIYSSIKGANEDIEAFSASLDSLRVVLEKFCQSALVAVGNESLEKLQALEEPLKKLKREVEEAAKELGKIKSRRRWVMQVKWGLVDSKKFEAWMQSFETYKTLLVMAITMESRERMQSLHGDVNRMEQKQDSWMEEQREWYDAQDKKATAETIEKVFDWLKPVNTQAIHRQAREAQLRGTGRWFVPYVEEWKDGRREYVWLEGIPGSGKTVLISSAVDFVQQSLRDGQPGILLSYYFSFSDSSKALVSSMLMSFIGQLVSTKLEDGDQSAFRTLFTLYEGYKHSKDRPEVKTLIKTFQDVVQTLDVPLFVVLDALDECSDTEELFQFVRSMHDSQDLNFRLLLSSRPRRDIHQVVSQDLGFHVITIEPDVVDADVAAFADHYLMSNRRLAGLTDDMKSMIRERVTSSSNGMFRLAVCQFQHLEQPRIRSRQTIESVLETMPTELDEMYARILNAISVEDREDVRRILTWLVATSRPLKVKEVAQLLLLDPANDNLDAGRSMFHPLDDILTLCNCLVTTQRINVDDDDGDLVVVLAHQSVADYLLQLPQSGHKSSYFSIRMDDADWEIFSTSWKLLPVIERVYLSVSADQLGTLRHPDLMCIDDLITYCMEYWLFHVMRASGSLLNPSIGGLIYSLLPLVKSCSRCDIPNSPEDFMKTFKVEHGEIPMRTKILVDVAQSFGYYFASLDLLTHWSLRDWHRRRDVMLRVRDHFLTHPPTTPVSVSFQTFKRFVIHALRRGMHGAGPALRFTDMHTLRWAIRNRDMAFVKWLLDEVHANVNAGEGRCIATAAEIEDLEMMEFLFERGLKLSLMGPVALWSVISGGSSGLFERSVKILTILGEGKTTENLNGSISPQKLKSIDFLIRHGADVNGFEGLPLQAAVESGNIEWVKFLAKHGARINSQALWTAVSLGHLHILEYLLDNGANINAITWWDGPFTVLDFACDPNLAPAVENHFSNIIRNAVNSKVIDILKTRGGKTAAELGVTKQSVQYMPQFGRRLALGIIETGYALIFVCCASFLYAWTSVVNVLAIIHISQIWAKFFNTHLMLPVTNVALADYVLLAVAFFFYRYVDGSWVNWDISIAILAVMMRWSRRVLDAGRPSAPRASPPAANTDNTTAPHPPQSGQRGLEPPESRANRPNERPQIGWAGPFLVEFSLIIGGSVVAILGRFVNRTSLWVLGALIPIAAIGWSFGAFRRPKSPVPASHSTGPQPRVNPSNTRPASLRTNRAAPAMQQQPAPGAANRPVNDPRAELLGEFVGDISLIVGGYVIGKLASHDIFVKTGYSVMGTGCYRLTIRSIGFFTNRPIAETFLERPEDNVLENRFLNNIGA